MPSYQHGITLIPAKRKNAITESDLVRKTFDKNFRAYATNLRSKTTYSDPMFLSSFTIGGQPIHTLISAEVNHYANDSTRKLRGRQKRNSAERNGICGTEVWKIKRHLDLEAHVITRSAEYTAKIRNLQFRNNKN